MSAETIHYGPIWFKRERLEFGSFAACDAAPPNVLSTHKPWVTCEVCKRYMTRAPEVCGCPYGNCTCDPG